jgi:hypothetical protein
MAGRAGVTCVRGVELPRFDGHLTMG